MKKILAPAIFAVLMLTGAQAFANDAMKSDTMTSQQKQMMKNCMAKQKAMNNGMSKEDMKSACMAQMQQKMNSSPTSDDSAPAKQ